MATHLRLIRPASSLAKNQSHLCNSSLYTSYSRISNGRLATPGSIGTVLTNRGFSGTISKFNDNSAGNSKGSKNSASNGEAIQKATEDEALKKAAEDAERKRVEAQDAVLKEILESAAAEKRQLEEEAAKVAEQKARLAAKKAAEEEARRAAKEASEKQALEMLQKSKSSNAASNVPEITSASVPRGEATKSLNSTVESSTSSKVTAASNQLHGSEASFTLNSSAADTTQPKSDTKEKSMQSELGETPGEPFASKLLPYKKSIDSSTEYIRSVLPDSLRQLTESVKRKDYQGTISQLAEHLNKITGYNSINELKHKVIAHGDRLDEARIKLVQAKQAYEDAVSTRSDTQKAINDLLQRKHLWSPNDVIRFTDLYRSEHANEQAEQKTKAAYKLAEEEVESKSRMLTRVIMERYHEEQVWSDKIRAASTYGTWSLVGANVVAFLVVQAFVEPRRRRKQVERYEELVQDLTERGILPEKTSILTTAATTTDSNTANSKADSDSISAAESGAPVAVGGELLGGEDVLLKLMKSAEERLDRVETLLIEQSSGSQGKKLPKETSVDLRGSPESGEYVLIDDGSIAFVSNDDIESTDLGESWGEGLPRSTRFQLRPDLSSDTPKGRLSLILSDGDVEVPATRQDFLVSSLGGAIIGGLIAVAVMMNRS